MNCATDVLVVGAGPAGSVAALILARAGARVRLIDRATFPRNKLCGDTLNPGALSILDRLGVSADLRGRALRLTGMSVTGPHGAAVNADYPLSLYAAALTRYDVDVVLLRAAVDAGAVFDSGVVVRKPLTDGADDRVAGVRIKTDRGERDLSTRMVIAADGRHSTLAFALGMSRFAAKPKRWAFGAYFTHVAGLTSRGEMHIRPDGYIGIAPLPGDMVNVCVVRERQHGAPRPPTKPDAIIAAALTSNPTLRDRFAASRRISPVAVLGPLGVDNRTAGRPGLLLAGDAAGFIDPMTGDGLRFAVRGGELAAEAALVELASGVPAFHTLRAARTREFASKWRVNRALRSLVGSPPALAVAARLASYWSFPFQQLINVAGDVAVAREGAPVSV